MKLTSNLYQFSLKLASQKMGIIIYLVPLNEASLFPAPVLLNFLSSILFSGSAILCYCLALLVHCFPLLSHNYAPLPPTASGRPPSSSMSLTSE